MDNQQTKIVVVGAGISGIRAALDLAEIGHQVCLIEKNPAMGGILTQLDHQFPDNHCGMCRMLPMIDRDKGQQFCLRKGLFHDNISLILSSEVISVEGSPGNLTLTLSQIPKGVDPSKCIGCRSCEAACPVEAPDTFNEGYGIRKAVYLPVPHQIPNTRAIDWNVCTKCEACKEVCPTGAIDLDNAPQTIEMGNVATVILASGVELFNPRKVDLYGMDQLPNVITAAAFERIMSSSGPTEGKPVRPSDGKPIKKIAWVQCVGSRNIMIDADYCSSACCMFAIKEALLAKKNIGNDAETTIFYMDMRTFGRDFQRYRDQAEKETNVRFVRCRIHSFEPGIKDGDIKVGYVDHTGARIEEEFDLMVLSTGKNPKHALPEFAGQEGVYTLDSSQAFMDISGSVIGANAATELAHQMIHQAGFTPDSKGDVLPQLPEYFNKRPFIQVVICSCGDTFDKQIMWENIEEELNSLPGSLNVLRMKTVCDRKNWDEMKAILRDGPANRLLLAACNPLVYQPRLKELEEETGILQSLMEVVNLRNLISSGANPKDVTRAAVQELEMSINRLRNRKIDLPESKPVTQKALIVGAGPAGLAAAVSLAARKIDVTIVEKANKIGGNLVNIQDVEIKETIQKLASEAENHPRITIHLESQVAQSFGTPGQFVSRIRHQSGEEEPVMHGATILATGGEASETQSYSCNESDKITTVFDLEKKINEPDFAKTPVKTAVFIQCVDSREEPKNYCSRLCCIKSVKSAIKIVDTHPDAQVYVFYRDIMTYGESEKFYTEARKKGVMFIPFSLENKPQIQIDTGRVIVSGHDPILNETVSFDADIAALATGVHPNTIDTIQSAFGVNITQDGFIKEADSKWRPVDTGKEGIFVCGLARNPLRADEAVKEGKAAAQRAIRILSKEMMISPRQVARVRHAICSLCEICIESCPYGARYVEPELGRIMVDPASCQGCGTCAAACPNSATVMAEIEETGIMDAIEAAL